MSAYVLTHLGDDALLHGLRALVARERAATAAVLAHIAEVDTRRLYVPAGFPSMHAYCVGELRFSEDAAYKRIQAARAARQFPAIFTAVAEGRLHLTGLGLLVPHLTMENARELLAEASHRSKAEIDQLLARRFPRTEVLTWEAASSAPSAPAEVGPTPKPLDADVNESSCQLAPAQVGVPRTTVTPLSTESFALQFTIGKGTHEKLAYVRALLSHRLASGDVAQVFDLALDALAERLERQKFARTTKPRARSGHASSNPRHIPAQVKRAVWERDGGRCTFVSEGGRRCPARERLEFDHIDAVARGGRATVANMRLRCRAHNQYAAECAFGTEFMEQKRREARHARDAGPKRAAARESSEAADQAAERDVIPWLRQLGFRADEARRAAARCEAIPDAPLEERVRLALSCLSPRAVRHGQSAANGGPLR